MFSLAPIISASQLGCSVLICSSPSMENLKVLFTNLQSFPLGLVRGLLTVLLHILESVRKTTVAIYFPGEELSPSERENCPSSVLVPVPFQFNFKVDSTKEQIPVLKFGEILRRIGSQDDQDEKKCAVCLTCMKEDDEVREIQSCFHFFHRECLDAWIDSGKITCPLCRSDMLSEKKLNCHGDPWRKQRLVYLFGEDVSFS